jgi:hypothetical protein
MKKCRKIISIVLVLVFLFSSVSAFAMAPQRRMEQIQALAESSSITEVKELLRTMSTAELDALISDIASKPQLSFSRTDVLRGPGGAKPFELVVAWLAAAQVLRVAGNPCVANLIEHSIDGINYFETNGVFAPKIKSTSSYRAWTQWVATGPIIFTSSDNLDLFLSLHKANISLVSSGSNGARVRVSDTFNFELSGLSGFSLASIVNDWGWLCQNAGVLTPISVTIDFNA